MKTRDLVTLLGLGVLSALLPPGCGCQPEPMPGATHVEEALGPDNNWVTINDFPDGSSFFQQGPYRFMCPDRSSGADTPAGAAAVRQTMKGLVEKTKTEIKQAEREIEACRNKMRSGGYYDQQYGCDSTDGRRKEFKRQRLIAEKRWRELMNQNDQLAREIRGENARLKSDLEKMTRTGEGPGKADIDKRKADIARREAQIKANETEIPKLDEAGREAGRYEEVEYEKCRQAQTARAQDPCSDTNTQNRQYDLQNARNRLAGYERRLTTLDSCVKTAQPQRPTIDPGFILQSPGLFTRPPSRRPAPSSPSHKD